MALINESLMNNAENLEWMQQGRKKHSFASFAELSCRRVLKNGWGVPIFL
jgi:hypothetical protein